MALCPQPFSLQTFSFAAFPGPKEPPDALGQEWICQEPCPARPQLFNHYDPSSRAVPACFPLSFSKTVILLFSFPIPVHPIFPSFPQTPLHSSAFQHTESPAPHPPSPTSVSQPHQPGPCFPGSEMGQRNGAKFLDLLGIQWQECRGSCPTNPATQGPLKGHTRFSGFIQDTSRVCFQSPGSPWCFL